MREAHSNWRQKRRGNDARMPFSLIYFFAPISIFYIPHNYVIPQAMPHAIPQTHSVFYPHRSSARASRFLVHFCDVHWTTTTWNLPMRHFMEDVNIQRQIFLFLFEHG